MVGTTLGSVIEGLVSRVFSPRATKAKQQRKHVARSDGPAKIIPRKPGVMSDEERIELLRRQMMKSTREGMNPVLHHTLESKSNEAILKPLPQSRPRGKWENKIPPNIAPIQKVTKVEVKSRFWKRPCKKSQPQPFTFPPVHKIKLDSPKLNPPTQIVDITEIEPQQITTDEILEKDQIADSANSNTPGAPIQDLVPVSSPPQFVLSPSIPYSSESIESPKSTVEITKPVESETLQNTLDIGVTKPKGSERVLPEDSIAEKKLVIDSKEAKDLCEKKPSPNSRPEANSAPLHHTRKRQVSPMEIATHTTRHVTIDAQERQSPKRVIHKRTVPKTPSWEKRRVQLAAKFHSDVHQPNSKRVSRSIVNTSERHRTTRTTTAIKTRSSVCTRTM